MWFGQVRFSNAEYIHDRDEAKAALAAIQVPEMAAIVNAADYLQNIARVWQDATDEDHRDMTRVILEDLICDPEAKRLISLKPKPAFRLLFRHIRGLAERDGVFAIVDRNA